MGEIRIVGPGKTRGYPYPVCKKRYFQSQSMLCLPCHPTFNGSSLPKLLSSLAVCALQYDHLFITQTAVLSYLHEMILHLTSAPKLFDTYGIYK